MAAKKTKKATEKKPAAETAEKKAATGTPPAWTANGGIQFSSKDQKKPNSEFRNLDVKLVSVLKDFNPRKRPIKDDLEELGAAIKTNGLINPITVRPNKEKEGHYWIVAGERRFSAATKIVGFETINAIIRYDLDDDADALAVALSENSDDARFNLTYDEQGAAYAKLCAENWPLSKVAKETGTHQRTVRRTIDFHTKASPEVKKRVFDGSLNYMAGLELALADPVLSAKVLKQLPALDAEEIEKGKVETVSLAQVKRMLKAAAKESGAGAQADPSKPNNKQGSKAASAAVQYSWRSKADLHAGIGEACLQMVDTEEKDREYQPYLELRGAVAAMLWNRGDLDAYVPPPLDPATSEDAVAAAKELKRFDALVKAEAKKYKAKLDADGGGETEGETDEAVLAKGE